MQLSRKKTHSNNTKGDPKKLNTVLVLVFKKWYVPVQKREHFIKYKHSVFEAENSQPEISMAARQVFLNWQKQNQC